ncbi:MAG: hypothetical protein HBSAPP02_22060 [Phycisphaerae bacterium]|nr:MAG: hypothetical protein HRU71_05990 [Planctomycetia bacterium]GJQ27174.1 MAG: hypothetical protein HBSAPP02_22060 [Phycisphaerae bacterium]
MSTFELANALRSFTIIIIRSARKAGCAATLLLVAALSGCGTLDGFAGFGYASPAGSINFAQAPRAPGSADPFLNTTGSGNSQNPIFFPGTGNTFNNPTNSPPTNEPTDANSGNANTGAGGSGSGGG